MKKNKKNLKTRIAAFALAAATFFGGVKACNEIKEHEPNEDSEINTEFNIGDTPSSESTIKPSVPGHDHNHNNSNNNQNNQVVQNEEEPKEDDMVKPGEGYINDEGSKKPSGKPSVKPSTDESIDKGENDKEDVTKEETPNASDNEEADKENSSSLDTETPSDSQENQENENKNENNKPNESKPEKPGNENKPSKPDTTKPDSKPDNKPDSKPDNKPEVKPPVEEPGIDEPEIDEPEHEHLFNLVISTYYTYDNDTHNVCNVIACECGIEQEVVVKSVSHSFTKNDNGDGTVTYTCECGYSKTESIVITPPEKEHKHDYTKEVSASYAGNDEHRIVETYTCSNEDGKCDNITYTKELGTEACGYEDGVCQTCGHVKEVVKEHEHDYTKEISASYAGNDQHTLTATYTCSNEDGKCDSVSYTEELGTEACGYEDGVCQTCGHVKEVVKEHEHDYTKEISASYAGNDQHTLTATYTCSNEDGKCDKESYSEELGTETCGYENGVCQTCGHTKEIEHKHDYQLVESNITSGGGSHTINEKYECKGEGICDNPSYENTSTEACTPGNWESVDGQDIRRCTVCGDTLEIAESHTCVPVLDPNADPCQGYDTVCETCGKAMTIEGTHNYYYLGEEDGMDVYVCDHCGDLLEVPKVQVPEENNDETNELENPEIEMIEPPLYSDIPTEQEETTNTVLTESELSLVRTRKDYAR